MAEAHPRRLFLWVLDRETEAGGRIFGVLTAALTAAPTFVADLSLPGEVGGATSAGMVAGSREAAASTTYRYIMGKGEARRLAAREVLIRAVLDREHCGVAAPARALVVAGVAIMAGVPAGGGLVEDHRIAFLAASYCKTCKATAGAAIMVSFTLRPSTILAQTLPVSRSQVLHKGPQPLLLLLGLLRGQRRFQPCNQRRFQRHCQLPFRPKDQPVCPHFFQQRCQLLFRPKDQPLCPHLIRQIQPEVQLANRLHNQLDSHWGSRRDSRRDSRPGSQLDNPRDSPLDNPRGSPLDSQPGNLLHIQHSRQVNQRGNLRSNQQDCQAPSQLRSRRASQRNSRPRDPRASRRASPQASPHDSPLGSPPGSRLDNHRGYQRCSLLACPQTLPLHNPLENHRGSPLHSHHSFRRAGPRWPYVMQVTSLKAR